MGQGVEMVGLNGLGSGNSHVGSVREWDYIKWMGQEVEIVGMDGFGGGNGLDGWVREWE